MTAQIDQSAFQMPNTKTVELILPDGFALGAYQAGVLEVLVPYLLDQGLKIKHISGRSIGSVNSILLAGALNTNQPENIGQILNGFWRDLGKLGDRHLLPFFMAQKIMKMAENFNYAASLSLPKFPLRSYFSKLADQQAPLQKLGEILERHMTPEMWDAVREGYTETSVRASKPVRGLGTLRAIDIRGRDLNTDSIKSSCAAKIFGSYQGLLDGTYVRKSLFPSAPRTDIILSVPCAPANAVLTKREERAEQDRVRLFRDDRCLLQRVEAMTKSGKSVFNFRSPFIREAIELGNKTGIDWIRQNGPAILFEQSDIPKSPITAPLIPAEKVFAPVQQLSITG